MSASNLRRGQIRVRVEINVRFTGAGPRLPEEETRKREAREEGRGVGGGGGGRVYLAQKGSNFQRGCKNGGWHPAWYTWVACWVYKTPLSFFTSYLSLS